jgi:diguanylate cyclase (GGDEF)-like protein
MADSEDLVRLSFFADIGKDIVKERSMRGVMDRVMERIGMYFAPLNWSLLLVDADKDELVFKTVVGKAAENLKGVRVPMGEGIAGWTARTGQAAIVADADSDPRFSGRFDDITGFKTDSIIAVPLKTEDNTIGVIELVNKLNGERFTPFDLRVLSTIADFAAIAIEKTYYLRAARRLAAIDHLTGVWNRRGLDRIIAREQGRTKRYGTPLSVMLLDIDGFKNINDTLGHAAGDEVLKTVASVALESVRETDSVARYGGDEFMVVMPDTDAAKALYARDRLLAILREKGTIPPNTAFTVSIGVHTSKSGDFGTLFDNLDRDLYARKDVKSSLSVHENLIIEYQREENEPDQA